jgi:hypothetical protein
MILVGTAVPTSSRKCLYNQHLAGSTCIPNPKPPIWLPFLCPTRLSHMCYCSKLPSPDLRSSCGRCWLCWNVDWKSGNLGASCASQAKVCWNVVITAMYAFAGLLGPSLGGVFTDAHQLTWRFRFWINLRKSHFSWRNE